MTGVQTCALPIWLFDDAAALDDSLETLVQTLAKSNPEAMAQLKQVFWHGTEGWDLVLADRAAMSGRMVLSEFTRSAIAGFRAR